MSIVRQPEAPSRPIRVSEPRLGPEVEDAVLAVLRSGQLAQGPVVEELEALCARMAGTRFAVAVSSGTAALEATFEALELRPGDEVILPPVTFAATLNAALRAGLAVRFADVGPDWCLDPDAAAAARTPRTAAVVPVHLYGLATDVDRLRTLLPDLAIVEDAAQAHGARLRSRAAGGLGTAGCFSFYATKNVLAGEGGVVTTSDADLADRLRLLRGQGMRERYVYEMVGRNLRMTDLAAAVAVPQLRRLDEITSRRAANAEALTERLAGTAGLVLPREPAGRQPVWHQYTVLLPSGIGRKEVVAAMAARDVYVGIYYPRLVWDAPAYQGHPGIVGGADPAATPRAADLVRRCVSLPVHPYLSEGDLDRIAEALADALR